MQADLIRTCSLVSVTLKHDQTNTGHTQSKGIDPKHRDVKVVHKLQQEEAFHMHLK